MTGDHELTSGQLVEAARKRKGWTLQHLGDEVGGVSPSFFSKWKKGESRASLDLAKIVAEKLGMDYEPLRVMLVKEKARHKIGKVQNGVKVQLSGTAAAKTELKAKLTVFEGSLGDHVSLVVIPILGQVPAGNPVRITPEVAGLAESYESIHRGRISQVDRVFGFRVRGDSMIERGISPGDVVIVDTGIIPQSGDIAIITIKGEAAVKEIYHTKDGIMLVSANPRIPKQTITDPDKAGLRVVGKVVKIVKNT